jgi:hypothetical protein
LTIILHFIHVNSDVESQNWHWSDSYTLYVLPHSPFHIFKWFQSITLIITIIHHTAQLHGKWRCVRKDGDFHRMSYFWSIWQAYCLSCLLLLARFWRWFLAPIVDSIDTWWSWQQFLVTNFPWKDVTVRKLSKSSFPKIKACKLLFLFFFFNFSISNMPKFYTMD